MNCVKKVLRVALGTPLRGVAVQLMTLSSAVGNNGRNQQLWELVWHSRKAVYLQPAAQIRQDVDLRQDSENVLLFGLKDLSVMQRSSTFFTCSLSSSLSLSVSMIAVGHDPCIWPHRFYGRFSFGFRQGSSEASKSSPKAHRQLIQKVKTIHGHIYRSHLH